MVTSVDIEHEVDERALQPRAQPPVEGKARARDLGGALEVENAQLRAEVPVGLRFEVELPRLAHAPHLHVVFGIFAHRHGFMGNVGNTGQQVSKRHVERLDQLIAVRDHLLLRAHLLLQLAGVGALALQLSDRGALGIHLGLQLFGQGDCVAPLSIQLAKAVEAGNVAAGGQALRDPVEVAPEK